MGIQKKKVIIILSVVAAALLVISILVANKSNASNNVVLNINKPVIEFNENIVFEVEANSDDNDLALIDSIIIKQASKFEKIEKIQYSRKKIGEHTGFLSVSNDGLSRQFYFKYKVHDTTPPIITLLEPVIAPVGNPYNLNDYISVTDNSLLSTEQLNFEIIGEINWDVAGVYDVIVTAIDSSDNESSLNIQIIVEGGFVEDPAYFEPANTDEYYEPEQDIPETNYEEDFIEEEQSIDEEVPSESNGDESSDNEDINAVQ